MIEAAIICLALNIYHEARDQPVLGQIAVSQVVLNRVNDPRYPNSVCRVVRQAKYSKKTRQPIKWECSFSWFCDGMSDKVKDLDAYRWALTLSGRVLQGEFAPLVDGATHYHNIFVNPKWAEKKVRVGKIGDHIFYRWER